MNFGYVVSICIILLVKHFEAPIERLPCCWPWRPQGSCGGIPFERLRCTSGATVRNLDIACWAGFFVDNQADNSKFRAAWAAVHLRVSKCFSIIFLFRGPFLILRQTHMLLLLSPCLPFSLCGMNFDKAQSAKHQEGNWRRVRWWVWRGGFCQQGSPLWVAACTRLNALASGHLTACYGNHL